MYTSWTEHILLLSVHIKVFSHLDSNREMFLNLKLI